MQTKQDFLTIKTTSEFLKMKIANKSIESVELAEISIVI